METMTAKEGDNGPNMDCTLRYDPMLHLDGLAMEEVLTYLDDQDLLRCGQVSRLWRHTISSRNAMWRRRCRQFVTHDDMTLYPNTQLFSAYVYSRKVLTQMKSSQSWDVEDQPTNIHEETKSRQPEWGATMSISDIVGAEVGTQGSLPHGKLFVCTTSGELVVVDARKKKVLWRTDSLTTKCACLFGQWIFTVTRTGNIEVFSTDGKDRNKIDVRGMLIDTRKVSVHRGSSILRVRLNDDTLVFVNSKLNVYQVEVPPPKLPQLVDAELEPIVDMIFDVRGAETGHFTLCVNRRTSVCFMVVTDSGTILHHQSVKYSVIHKWMYPFLRDKDYYKLVIAHEGHLEAISIQFTDAKVILKQLWKKALPAKFSADPDKVIVAGKKFLLTRLDGGLQVYRMNDGTMACELPSFSTRQPMRTKVFQAIGISTGDTEKDMSEIVARQAALRDAKDSLYIVNVQWLDGLSPETTDPNFIVMASFSKEYPRGKFLRWSRGLWEALSEAKEAESED